MPPLEPPERKEIPMPVPARSPPMMLAVRLSLTRGVAGIGNILRNIVWLIRQTSVRLKKLLPIEIYAMINKGIFKIKLIIPAISVPDASDGNTWISKVRMIWLIPRTPPLYRLAGTIKKLIPAANKTMPPIAAAFLCQSVLSLRFICMPSLINICTACVDYELQPVDTIKTGTLL